MCPLNLPSRDDARKSKVKSAEMISASVLVFYLGIYSFVICTKYGFRLMVPTETVAETLNKQGMNMYLKI